MSFDLSAALDSVMDGTKEIAEVAHEKTNSFHENYISRITPDCGKYGDEVKFVAEMVPGIAEYNAIKAGDWVSFAIAAGLDITAIAAGAFTAGAGYATVKGGGTAAKAGVHLAVKEIAESGAEGAMRKSVKAVIKETAEVGGETGIKEKLTREIIEKQNENTAQKVAKEGTEKTRNTETDRNAESLDELAQVTKNKLDGTAREEQVMKDLVSKNGENNIIREALLRNKDGIPIKDPESGEARKIDFIVTKGEKVIESIEVTSETADKTSQMAKQARILEQAEKQGGAFIKDKHGDLIEFTRDIITEIRRLP